MTQYPSYRWQKTFHYQEAGRQPSYQIKLPIKGTSLTIMHQRSISPSSQWLIFWHFMSHKKIMRCYIYLCKKNPFLSLTRGHPLRTKSLPHNTMPSDAYRCEQEQWCWRSFTVPSHLAAARFHLPQLCSGCCTSKGRLLLLTCVFLLEALSISSA